MPALQASRFRLRAPFILFALFLGAVAAVTGLWFIGAHMVRDQIATFGSDLAAEGGSFSTASLRVTGFPFSFTAHASDIRMQGRGARGPWEWRARRASVSFSPWRAGDFSFDLAGTHELRFHAGPVPLNLEISAAEAPATWSRRTADSPRMITIHPRAVTVHAPAAGWRARIARAEVQLYRQRPRPDSNADAVMGLGVNLEGVELPGGEAALLGRRLDRFSTALEVTGDPPLPIDRRRLSRWRNTGGALEVRELGLAWGPTRIDAAGTVGLDEALQPEASLTARITGYDEVVDALVKAGAVNPRAAEGLKLMLAMMARQSSPDRAREIRVPISIQDRTVYVGPARLARMPRIRW